MGENVRITVVRADLIGEGLPVGAAEGVDGAVDEEHGHGVFELLALIEEEDGVWGEVLMDL